MTKVLTKVNEARALVGDALREHPGAMSLDPLTRDLLSAVKALDSARRNATRPIGATLGGEVEA